MNSLDDVLGPDVARVARARKALEKAVAGVTEMAKGVKDFAPIGTAELGAAVAALASSEYVDEDEAGARWVSRAFTAGMMDLLPLGEDAMAFGGAVVMMRGALRELDEALAAMESPGPTEPGGTFSR
ncbi:hypothetical protein EF903_06930 [Streptomyces sp. WAC05292]|uniref:hypothetical protein n=1 Tax=Streptomyces sp. WAC05292 TaxID=2487418 RepID=UPI000F739E06|nr:hypothetical protein [Streptomyces sp. WAC05292]RSS94266.1 hypothetical protein EF903_06930 [Streptomyces sp. WAC05292]